MPPPPPTPTSVPPTPTPKPSYPSSATVSVQDNNRFGPNRVDIAAGGTVTWVWQGGGTPHDVTGSGMNSGPKTGGSYQFSFSSPGTYQYVCELHKSSWPSMAGTVVVH